VDRACSAHPAATPILQLALAGSRPHLSFRSRAPCNTSYGDIIVGRARSAPSSEVGAMRSGPGSHSRAKKGPRMVEAHEPVVAACPEARPEDIQHREDALDEALAQSFPASDPPAMVRPAQRPRLCAHGAAPISGVATGRASSSTPSPDPPTADGTRGQAEDRHFPDVLQDLVPLLDTPPRQVRSNTQGGWS
jgi:hypothetical protein